MSGGEPERWTSRILKGADCELALPAEPVRYHYSGWQSWSLTAWVDVNRRMRPPRPASLWALQVDPRYAREPLPNGSWYGAVEIADGQVVFLGALGLDAHVRLEGRTLHGWYEAGEGEWLAAHGTEEEVFSQYAALLADRLGRGRQPEPYRVWCSWYSLYTEIDEPRLHKVLAELEDLPFDVFQVDDGWQVSIGDWEPNSKFPGGMQALTERIKGSGRKAGLWLAPLLVVPSSRLYREHRDWLLRDGNNRLVSAGFNWGEPLYALDTTHPAVLEWLRALMEKVRGWGFEYAKLDFLYAGALPGRRYADMPREAAFRSGLQVIRQALGEAYLLTCGTPILPSLGLCDGMRVGPDVSGAWTSYRDDVLLMNYATPGSRNALRTTLNRLWLQPLVHTDPDVVYISPHQNRLSDEQKMMLQSLAHICRFKATSDAPAWLSGAEKAALRAFLEQAPAVSRSGRASYQVGERTIDFGPYIDLPPLPGMLADLQGRLVGRLADSHPLMRWFSHQEKAALRKRLSKDPV